MQGIVDGNDKVFHPPALIAIPYSYVAPQSYVNVNINGTLNILNACRQLLRTARRSHPQPPRYTEWHTTLTLEEHLLTHNHPTPRVKLARI